MVWWVSSGRRQPGPSEASARPAHRCPLPAVYTTPPGCETGERIMHYQPGDRYFCPVCPTVHVVRTPEDGCGGEWAPESARELRDRRGLRPWARLSAKAPRGPER
jgi:hypothetical protein